jgi:DNA ligase-1
MHRFVKLFTALDGTTKINAKVDALANYFNTVEDEDKLWTIALLSHRRPMRTVNTTMLRSWAGEMAGIPGWLFEESYHVVGDLAETIALLLPKPSNSKKQSLSQWIYYIKALADKEEEEKKAAIISAWDQMESKERFVFNKLITGGFRMGVSQKLMVRALSKSTDIEENKISHRIMGDWTPFEVTFEDLILSESDKEDISKPYPFYLAYSLEGELERLVNPDDWIAERKWDGIRGQLIVRSGEIFIWSRGEELITPKFPELKILVEKLPDGTVIDGEIMAFKNGVPLSFNHLQTRIGRKNVSKKQLVEAPAIIMAYDLLEHEGLDIRSIAMEERRNFLEGIIPDPSDDLPIQLSPLVSFSEWKQLRDEKEKSREHLCEGLMLKKKDSPYKVGRKKGDWWKWKVEPMTIDAIMLYAQRGHGRRANLFTDFTFAVWQEGRLVPFAKAYSGLTDEEFEEITRFVNRNTIERFGPVCSVTPELVFEIAFEDIWESKRHKSGIAVRFPRIKRWRKDKPKDEANSLEDLKGLLIKQ